MDSSYTVILLSFFQKKNFTQGHDKRGEKKLESASTLWYESFSLAFKKYLRDSDPRVIWDWDSSKSLVYYLNQVCNSNWNLCLKSQKDYSCLIMSNDQKGTGLLIYPLHMRSYLIMLSS